MGGLSFARTSYNDMYTFDLETEQWEKIVPNNNAPDGRGGHSCFASDGKIFIYGGWNQEMQFNNVWQYDIAKKEWFDPDCMHEIHRWNHSSSWSLPFLHGNSLFLVVNKLNIKKELQELSENTSTPVLSLTWELLNGKLLLLIQSSSQKFLQPENMLQWLMMKEIEG